jgi:hypothetical protein
MINEQLTKQYWVEARTAVKDHRKVIGYGVWHINANGARECVQKFSVNRTGTELAALYLARTLRDDLNNGVK